MNDRPWAVALVEDLTRMAAPDSLNRAPLAHLRRGLDGRPDYALARVGWLFRRVPESTLNAAVTAAGLFAWVKGECRQAEKVNFGAAFGAGLTVDQKQQREKRFIDLLDTDADELPYKLRQAITLIARDRVGLDWVGLIRDLRFWSADGRTVQKRWARGFWAVAETEPTADREKAVSE